MLWPAKFFLLFARKSRFLPKARFLLFTFYLSFIFLLTSPASALELPPIPPESTNYVTFVEDLTKLKTGPLAQAGSNFTLNDTAQRAHGEVEMRPYGGLLGVSESSLPFGQALSDYLEGGRTDERRGTNLATMSAQNLQKYYSPLQKLLPQKEQDKLKVAYLEELYKTYDPTNRTSYLEETTFKYSDINGENPRTLIFLREQWGAPNPQDLENWQKTWQRYWAKIPFATNYKSLGYLEVTSPPTIKDDLIQSRPGTTVTRFRLAVPDVFRLNFLTGIFQRIFLPQSEIQKEAQGQTSDAQAVLGTGNKITVLDKNKADVTGLVEVQPEPGTHEADCPSPPFYPDPITGAMPQCDYPDPPTREPVDAPVPVKTFVPFLTETWYRLSGPSGALAFVFPGELISGKTDYQRSAAAQASSDFTDTTVAKEGAVFNTFLNYAFLGGMKNAQDFVLKALWPFSK